MLCSFNKVPMLFAKLGIIHSDSDFSIRKYFIITSVLKNDHYDT